MKNRTPKAAPRHPAILTQICKALDDKKAENLRVLKVSEQSSITDYLVVATGTSDPHLRALRVELEKVLDSAKTHIVGMDTSQESGWLVIDAFDIMIHVMTPANRDKYALENLWKDAEEVPIQEFTAEPKAVNARPAAKKTAAPKKAATKRPATKKRVTERKKRS